MYTNRGAPHHIVEGIDYKEILSRIYEPFDNTFDFSMFFILRSIWFSKDKGYHSFIITNKWLRAKYGKKIRRFLKENLTIKKVIDFNGIRVFVGATVDTLVYVIQKKKPERDNLIFYNHPLSWDSIEQGGYKVKQASLSDDIWNFVDERTEEIKKWIEKVGKPLKDLDVKIYRGITTGFNEAFVIDNETRKKLIEEYPKSAELIKPLLRGRDIGRYYEEWDRKWIIIIPAGFTKNLIEKNVPLEEAEEFFKNEYPSIYSHFEQFKNVETGRGKGLVNRDDQGDYWWELRPCDYYPEFEKPKIVWQRVNRKPVFILDNAKMHVLDSNAFMTGNYEVLKFLNLLLLSKFIENYYVKNFVHLYGDKGYLLSNQYIEKIPIRLPKKPKYYENLADYLLFLNATEERRQEFKDTIEFFDRQIADSLVYELYFKEKFAEDGLYPEPKEYLLEEVSKHLKPINYDRRAELYWKKQIEGNLTEEEEELEDLENENLKTIIEVVEAIKADREIMELIERIKGHEWVKVVEGNPKIDREVEW